MKQISLAEVEQYHDQTKESADQSLAPSIEMHLQLHVHKLIHDFLFSSDGDHGTFSTDSTSPPKNNCSDMMVKEGNFMANQTLIWAENVELTTSNSNQGATYDQESSVSRDIMTIITVKGENESLTSSKPKDETKCDQRGLFSGDTLNVITVKDQKIMYCNDAKEVQDSNSNHVFSVIEMEEHTLFEDISRSNIFPCGGKANIISHTSELPFKSNTNLMSESTENNNPCERKANALFDSDNVSCEIKVSNSISKHNDRTSPYVKNNIRTPISDTETSEVKPSSRKPPRPPRLAKSPRGSAHSFLRCSSDINILLKSTRKVRIDRRKGGFVTSSTASSIWALIFTVFFAVAMLAQGSWFQSRSARQGVLASSPSDMSYMMTMSALSPPLQADSRVTYNKIKYESGSSTMRKDDTNVGSTLQLKQASPS